MQNTFRYGKIFSAITVPKTNWYYFSYRTIFGIPVCQKERWASDLRLQSTLNLIKEFVILVAGEGIVDYETFQILMSRHAKTLETVKELMEAFLVYDREKKGVVSCSDLRQVLQQVGEKLSSEEVDEIINSAENAPGGHIYYESMLKASSINRVIS